MVLDKITLKDDEMAQLKDIQDKYNASVKVMHETVEWSMMVYWNSIRDTYRLHNTPLHIIGNTIWYLVDASEEEQKAFLEMMGNRRPQ